MSDPQTLILFEDDAALTLEPLTLMRAVWDLRCGLRTLEEKLRALFTDMQIFYYPRTYLAPLYRQTNPPFSMEAQGGSALWINAAFIPTSRFSEVLKLPDRTAWMQDSRVIAMRGFPPENWQPGTQMPHDGFEKIEINSEFGRYYRYLWELVEAAPGEVVNEARKLRPLGQILGEIHPSAILIGPDDIYIAPGCKIGPLAVIDASAGPVVLDDEVQIGAHTVIEGPVYMGHKSRVKPLANVKECCFGPETRVGGEITDTIIQGFSNKQHGGFLGNSFLGSWCNLGSGTETSNLKNNYRPVKVQVGKDLVDSERLFVGLMMGDHSKSAIGSVFNTGTMVGVACNVVEPGFPPRYIPSFHWGGTQKLSPYPFNNTLEIARAVMARRSRSLTEAEVEVLRWIYDNKR